MHCCPILCACTGVLLASASSAQFQVWTVDDDGSADFAELTTAIEAASEGDALLVYGGNYESLAIQGKRLTLLAGDDEAVSLNVDPVSPFGASEPGITANGLTSAQPLLLVGLNLELSGLGRTDVVFASGSESFLWLQGVRLLGGGGVESGVGSVVIRDSVLEGLANTGGAAPFMPASQHDAITLHGGRLLAYDSSALGSLGSGGGCQLGFTCGDEGTGGDGVLLLSGASAHLVGCTLKGGDGLDQDCSAYGSPSTWYGNAGNGGDGLDVEAGSLALAIDCTFEAGVAGTTPTICSDGEAGIPAAGSGTLVLSTELQRRLTITSLVREGEAVDLTFDGGPGESILLGLALTPSVFDDPQIDAPLILGNLLTVIPFGELPASGVLQLSFPAGVLPPGVEFFTYYLQPVFITSVGERKAGDPMSITILDSAF